MIRMGNRNKTDQPHTQTFSDIPVTPSRAVSDSESMARDIKEGRLSGFVGHGTVLTGETNFQAMLRVDGHLIGTIASESGTLIVGSNGQVDANISVATALINGVVNGDVVASEKVQLGRTARVVGNLQAPVLVIEEGALFEGTSTMIRSREIKGKQNEETEKYVAQEIIHSDDLIDADVDVADDDDES